MDPVFQGKDVGLGGGLPAQRAFVFLTEGSLNTDGLGQVGGVPGVVEDVPTFGGDQVGGQV